MDYRRNKLKSGRPEPSGCNVIRTAPLACWLSLRAWTIRRLNGRDSTLAHHNVDFPTEYWSRNDERPVKEELSGADHDRLSGLRSMFSWRRCNLQARTLVLPERAGLRPSTGSLNDTVIMFLIRRLTSHQNPDAPVSARTASSPRKRSALP